MSKQQLNTSSPHAPLAYSINDLTKQLGVSRGHVNKLIARGELKTRKSGRRVLIARTEVVRWLESNGRGDA